MGEQLLNGNRVSVKGDEKALKMDGDDGCTTVSNHLIPVERTLKNAEAVSCT